MRLTQATVPSVRLAAATRFLVVATIAVGALPVLAGSASAASHASPAGLSLSQQRLVVPERARRLPTLLVPLKQPTEPEQDTAPPTGPEFGMVSVPPTPLITSRRRALARNATSPVVGGTLDGSSSSLVNPADVQVAAGPNDVVEMTNAGVDVWTTTGQLEQFLSLGAYFTSSGEDRRLDEMTDPRVLYDTQSQHWFAMALDVTTDSNILAVSPTPVPGAGSWIYTFPSSGCPDQPRLGISDNLVAFGDDLFSDCGSYGNLIGGEVTILNKASVLLGGPSGANTYGPSYLFGHITPVVSISPTPILWFAASDFLFDTVDLFAADKVAAGALGERTVNVGALSDAPWALQSDPALINTGDNRVQNAVWENNSLWIAISNGCTVNGETGVHGCARYIGINTTDSQNPSVILNSEMALDQNRDLFYPAVMPANDGTLYTVFGYSSANETPGIGITAQPQDYSGWETLQPGSGANESGRWGDYFGISRDPTDPSHIWVAAAYGTGGDSWATSVFATGASEFSIKPPPQPAPPPATHVCLVPQLTGLRLAAADTKLLRNHCSPGATSSRKSTRPKGIVIAQSKAPGDVLRAGAPVNLVISRGPLRHH